MSIIVKNNFKYDVIISCDCCDNKYELEGLVCLESASKMANNNGWQLGNLKNPRSHYCPDCKKEEIIEKNDYSLTDYYNAKEYEKKCINLVENLPSVDEIYKIISRSKTLFKNDAIEVYNRIKNGE